MARLTRAIRLTRMTALAAPAGRVPRWRTWHAMPLTKEHLGTFPPFSPTALCRSTLNVTGRGLCASDGAQKGSGFERTDRYRGGHSTRCDSRDQYIRHPHRLDKGLDKGYVHKHFPHSPSRHTIRGYNLPRSSHLRSS